MSCRWTLGGVVVVFVASAAPVLAQDAAKPAGTDAERIAESKSLFARADRNGDGTLREGELPKGWVERYDLDGDGRVARREFEEVIARPAKLRRPHPMRDPVPRAQDALRRYDANKDGLLQREEYPGDDQKFRGADRDRDGTLSAAELRGMAEDEIADIRKKMRRPNRYEFLVLFDLNGDSRVGADEFDGSSADFRKYDTDGDGTVTYAELYPERMGNMARNAEAMRPKPQDLDVLATMDANQDGRVTRAEFKGTDAAWRRLDRNGDNVLTVADAH